MPIRETKVSSFRHTYICDKCEKEEMKSTGLIFPTHPPQYPYICSKCGYDSTLDHAHNSDLIDKWNSLDNVNVSFIKPNDQQ